MAIPVAVGRAVGGAVGQVAIQMTLEKAFFNKDVKNTVKNTESAFSKGLGNVEKTNNKTFSAMGAFIKTAFVAVAVKGFVDIAKAGVNAASETQAAWTGLNSILTGTGKSFAEGKKFIDEYVSDGLIPLQDAVTSYKNLASRGYSTEQIEKTMLALKDAAAFGRQSSYSYGEAIKSATEGLKNENSILVDNAGVTKNVAKMWDEYAASIGTTANNLTQQQKIQAEVNGILEETKFQTGDAAAYANTFAGKLAKVNTAFYNFKVAVGKFVGPIVELFLPYIEMALNALTRFFNKLGQILKVFGLEMPDVVSKAGGAISSIGGSADSASSSIEGTGDAATKAAKKIKRAFAGVDEINVLNTSKDTDKSSGGSSSGGSSPLDGIGGAFSDDTTITDVTENLDSGAVKIANKLKELFAPFKEMDFSGITEGFEKIKKAAEPLTEKLFAGLEWLWHKVLVPFAGWTVEDLIPAFFNGIAGSLDFLNGIIDVAKPFLQWLWEEWLEPVAKWTGGVIVDVINKAGDALSKMGKWLSSIAPDITTVREELQPLKDIISKTGELLSAIYDRLKPTIELITKNLKSAWDNVLKPLLEFVFKQIWTDLKTVAKVIGGILDVLIGFVSLDFKKVKDGLSGIWTAIKDGFSDTLSNWKDLGGDLVGGLWQGIKDAFGNATEWVKKAIFEPMGKGITNSKDYMTEKWNEVKGWFTNIKKTASVEIKQKWEDIKKKWTDLTKNIKSKTATMKASVTQKWADIKKKWTDLTKNVKNKTASMKATVGTTWSQLRNKWNSLMANFKDKTITIRAKVGEIIGSFKSVINDKIIGPINKQLPSWLPKIPKLAQGGWLQANNPRLAIVGDNKTEGEIVAPESKIKEQVVKGIQEAGATNNQIELVINVKYEDGRSIIKKINNTQIKDGKISLIV